MAKLFYTISETAELLDEKVTTVRFWSNCFAKHLKLGRNGHNNRRYAPSDIEGRFESWIRGQASPFRRSS